MKSLQALKNTDISGVRVVCTDIDDTLTRYGKLGKKAYTALWDLYEAGFRVIPVTGRPAGWCDLIAREWPVDAVVGENGAFAFYIEGGHLKHMYHPSAEPENIDKRLADIRERVLEKVPEARVSKDQFSRMFDLAIDFREEEPDLGYETAEQIAAICRSMGAVAKISSIHVNTWFGEYSKVDMLVCYLQRRWQLDENEQKAAVLYCGDSPNDEPMFEHFPLSCGVANIKPMLHLLTHKPAYITASECGDGFAEVADMLLNAK